jgi:hypothetical protein
MEIRLKKIPIDRLEEKVPRKYVGAYPAYIEKFIKDNLSSGVYTGLASEKMQVEVIIEVDEKKKVFFSNDPLGDIEAEFTGFGINIIEFHSSFYPWRSVKKISIKEAKND